VQGVLKLIVVIDIRVTTICMMSMFVMNFASMMKTILAKRLVRLKSQSLIQSKCNKE